MAAARRAAVGVLAALLALGYAASGLTTSTAATPPPLVIIFMENKSYSDITNHAAYVPYEMGFVTQGVRFTHYSETPKPSLPNYLTLGAGSTCGKLGTDKIAAGSIGAAAGCPTTVWNQLESAGVTWGVYEDDMPTPCYGPHAAVNQSADGGTGDEYALKHNPATPFASIWSNPTLCKAHVLPYSSFSPTALPAVSFIAAGECDDQHGGLTGATNCATGSNALYARGDKWLKNNVPAMLAAGATVIITYDGPANPMYTVEVGPGITPGTTDGAAYSHLSILAAIEDRYGLTRLNNAATATPLPLGG